MGNLLMSMGARAWFRLISRDKASERIRKLLDRYSVLAGMTTPETGSIPILVPQMKGVDENMRNWSFFMILEHNTIVNCRISTIVKRLYHGEEPTEAFDPKNDVMPSIDPGEEQLEAFRSSVEAHLSLIPELGRLRGGLTKRHPTFGDFDAHSWHCMFGFHLLLHLRQAEYVIGEACDGR